MTNFSSKAYTLSFLIKNVSKVGTNVNSYSEFARALSPRAGTKSVQLKALNKFLNGKLRSIVNNSNVGGSIKERVLVALKARKKAVA